MDRSSKKNKCQWVTDENRHGNKKQKTPPTEEDNQSSSNANDPLATVVLEKNNPPAAASMNEQIDQIISKMKENLSVLKRRNDYSRGTMGRPIEVVVNFIPLDLNKLCTTKFYHINVLFTPQHSGMFLRMALKQFVEKNYNNIPFAFDNYKNMYTMKEITPKTGVVSILNVEDNATIDFNIFITDVKLIDMSKIGEYLTNTSSNVCYPNEAISALNIIIKNPSWSLRLTNIGQYFYTEVDSIQSNKINGFELKKGFFQNPILGWKPYLNVHVTHRGFYKCQSLIKYLENDLDCNLNSKMSCSNIDTLHNYVKGLKIEFMVPNKPESKRRYTVYGVFKTTETYSFQKHSTNNNETINVFNYLKNKWNYIVKYPNLPCIHVGYLDKKLIVPLELCTIVNKQIKCNKSNNLQPIITNNYNKQNELILNYMNYIKYNNDAIFKECEIAYTNQLITVPARILNQPSLNYKNSKINPINGSWRSMKFFKAVRLTKWKILNMDQCLSNNSISSFSEMIVNIGKELNMTIKPLSDVINIFTQNDLQTNIENCLIKAKADNIELVIVVIPDDSTIIYDYVKQSAELSVGILTQCIKSNTLVEIKRNIILNILCKINTKLNGINYMFTESPKIMEKAIIFGADVTHPSAYQTYLPSIAAVTASCDSYGVRYNVEMRLLSPHVEIIKNMEDIFYKQLMLFIKKTKYAPKRIFYIRDGVCDNQFQQLLDDELIAIQKACMRIQINYRPPVTLLIVQKRHHTIMFSKSNNNSVDNVYNIPTGTVIDTHITRFNEMEYYLCSHNSNENSSKPMKYRVLWDDSNFTLDQLEELTFHLCFMCVRCTHTISYPVPTYYAHLAAYRARSYITNKNIDLNNLDKEQEKIKLHSQFSLNMPMFFI